MVLGFFGVHFTTIYGPGPIGIAFSFFVVIIAALNLVLDFDFIESAVGAGAREFQSGDNRDSLTLGNGRGKLGHYDVLRELCYEAFCCANRSTKLCTVSE